MRWMLVAGYLLCSGYACDGAPTALFALTSDATCEDLSCPLAVGAETSVLVSFDGRVTEVIVTPPELATLAFDADTGWLQVRPNLAGAGKLVVRAGQETVLVRDITAAEVYSTSIEPRARINLWDGWIDAYPEGTSQLYHSTMMRVVAVHRDTSGRPLLGHGLETWSIDGGSFRLDSTPPSSELSSDRELVDPALFRDIVDDGSPQLSIAVRGGIPALVLGVHSAGSTSLLAIDGVGDDGELRVGVDAEVRPRVLAYDIDGRYIHGTPVGGRLDIEVGDPNILVASAISDRRSVFLRGRRSGATTLTIRFDGREARYPVRVR